MLPNPLHLLQRAVPEAVNAEVQKLVAAVKRTLRHILITQAPAGQFRRVLGEIDASWPDLWVLPRRHAHGTVDAQEQRRLADVGHVLPTPARLVEHLHLELTCPPELTTCPPAFHPPLSQNVPSRTDPRRGRSTRRTGCAAEGKGSW